MVNGDTTKFVDQKAPRFPKRITFKAYGYRGRFFVRQLMTYASPVSANDRSLAPNIVKLILYVAVLFYVCQYLNATSTNTNTFLIGLLAGYIAFSFWVRKNAREWNRIIYFVSIKIEGDNAFVRHEKAKRFWARIPLPESLQKDTVHHPENMNNFLPCVIGLWKTTKNPLRIKLVPPNSQTTESASGLDTQKGTYVIQVAERHIRDLFVSFLLPAVIMVVALWVFPIANSSDKGQSIMQVEDFSMRTEFSLETTLDDLALLADQFMSVRVLPNVSWTNNPVRITVAFLAFVYGLYIWSMRHYLIKRSWIHYKLDDKLIVHNRYIERRFMENVFAKVYFHLEDDGELVDLLDALRNLSDQTASSLRVTRSWRSN